MSNILEKSFDIKLVILDIYFIVVYCSFFNIAPKSLQLSLFIALIIIFADKIKVRTIVGALVIGGIHIFSFLYAKNFGFGFWDPINFIMKYIALFELFVIYDIFSSLESVKKSHVLKITLFAISITNFISIYYNLGDMYAIRYRPEQYSFIINFNQFYALPILISTLTSKILFKKAPSALLLTTLVSSIIVLLIGNLMTGLILGAFSVLLVMLLWLSKSNYINQLITILVTLLAAIFLRHPLANLLKRISTWSLFSELAASKLLVAAKVLVGGEVTSTLSVRNDYKGSAISSFKEYPYFGLPYDKYRYGTISGHADWYDILAMNGFVGFIALLLVLIDLCIRIFKNISEQTDLISFIVAITIFSILGFLNPSFSVEILLMTFILSSHITYL
ncbi:hypothetical protein ACSHWF_06745 [Aerococcus urinaeequi]|uniref:hypothetical protein n=1 Tax=Aerococcus urinaeequi TaxID=51665 RepID=UPI003ED86800